MYYTKILIGLLDLVHLSYIGARTYLNQTQIELPDTLTHESEPPVAEDTFAQIRLSRQETRDSAVELLQEAMAYGDETNKTESTQQLETIVQTALTEAQIESLIIAKGYTDCVAYMSTEGVSIAVSAPEGGLQANDVAVIADIVMTQSEYTLDEIRIVEVQ